MLERALEEGDEEYAGQCMFKRFRRVLYAEPVRDHAFHVDLTALDELHNPPTDHMFARMQADSIAHTFRTRADVAAGTDA